MSDPFESHQPDFQPDLAQIESTTFANSEPGIMQSMLGNKALRVVAGVAAIGAFMVAESGGPSPINDGPAIAEAVVCNPSDPNVNTDTCTPPVKELVKTCPSKTTDRAYNGIGSQFRLETGYNSGSTSDFKVKTRIYDIDKYCNQVMKRTWKVQQVLREGPTGSFLPNGNSYTVRTNDKKTINQILKAPVNCDDPKMAGSAYETNISTKAVATKKYRGKLKGKTSASWHTSPTPIC